MLAMQNIDNCNDVPNNVPHTIGEGGLLYDIPHLLQQLTCKSPTNVLILMINLNIEFSHMHLEGKWADLPKHEDTLMTSVAGGALQGEQAGLPASFRRENIPTAFTCSKMQCFPTKPVHTFGCQPPSEEQAHTAI